MNGTLFVVGVGPGDPELLTLKAARVIREADVIACPAKESGPGAAYDIAVQAIPEIVQKEVLPLAFPMIRTDLSDHHQAIAEQLQEILRTGKNVAFLTLGDPGFYSTPYYIIDLLLKEGYAVEVVSGVASFSAASARLQIPLAMGEESVLIECCDTCDFQDFSGTQVVLKAGSHIDTLKEKIRSAGKTAYLIENCGMANEKVYSGIESFPAKAGYFSMIVIQ